MEGKRKSIMAKLSKYIHSDKVPNFGNIRKDNGLTIFIKKILMRDN